MDKNKKRFISTIVSTSAFVWLFQIILGGILQAVVAFFTKRKLEELKEEKEKEKEGHTDV